MRGALAGGRWGWGICSRSCASTQRGDAGLADSSGGCRYIGNSTLKRTVVPREGALSIEISPPISLTCRWQIERPRPVPPERRLIDGPACTKGLKSDFSASGAMPTPVSDTWNISFCDAGRAPAAAAIDRQTCPDSVNLIALESRFTRICRTRTRSPTIRAATFLATATRNSSPLARAWPASRPATLSHSARRSKRRRGFMHHIQHLPLLGVRLAMTQQFDEAKHAIHRRADFMTHHRQKSVFGALGAAPPPHFNPQPQITVKQRSNHREQDKRDRRELA